MLIYTLKTILILVNLNWTSRNIFICNSTVLFLCVTLLDTYSFPVLCPIKLMLPFQNIFRFSHSPALVADVQHLLVDTCMCHDGSISAPNLELDLR